MKRLILYRDVMKNVLAFLAVILFFTVLVYGIWRLERWWHYKFSYSSQVSEQVQPMVDRIVVLEKRVDALEKK